MLVALVLDILFLMLFGTGSDVLAKKHRLSEVQWLFNTLNLAAHDNKLKSVEEIIMEINFVIKSISEVQSKFTHHCFAGKPFDDLSTQEQVLKVYIHSETFKIMYIYA